MLSLDCFKLKGVFHRSRCYCGVESGVWRVIDHFQMNSCHIQNLIYIFLGGMYYSTRGGHCTGVKNAATPCTTEMYNTKTVCFSQSQKAIDR